MTVKDLKSIIKDTVSASLADKVIDAEKETRALFDAALKKGDPEFMRKLQALMTGSSNGENADKLAAARDYRMEMDPHKGKGLTFARAVRCATIAKQRNKDTKEVAREFAARGFLGYGHIADMLDEAEKTTRAMEAGTLSGAGVLIPEQLAGEFIELLYAMTVATKLGARDIGFRGSLSMGRLNSGATVSYVGEEGLITPSQQGLGAVKLTGKKAAGLVAITNELLALASPGADAIIRDDLLMAMALRRDLSFYRGTGSEAQPKGVYLWTKAANHVNQTGTTLAAAVTDYLGLCRLVEESNVPMDSAAFVMAPRTFWGLAKILDGQGQFVFMPMLMAGQLFGFKFGKTTQIPTNLAGTQSEVYFGVHNDVMLGRDESRPLEVEMQPNGAYHNGSAVVAGFSNDTTPVRIIESHDVAARHDNTFAILEQVTLQ
ncbi:MAG: phage major capsid protein [Archangium sp.]|nr:phage major capsid protein [Archangium sp.]